MLYIFKNADRTSGVKQQIIYSFILKGISLLISLIYVPLLIDVLDKERYGIWLTLITIFSWFTFFDVGLGNGLRNKLCKAIALKDFSLGKKYVSTTYALFVIIFFIVFIFFHLINYFIDWNKILNTTIVPNKELYFLTSIIFSFFILRFIFQLAGIIYLADQRPAVSNAVNAIGNFLSLTLIWTVSKFNCKIDLIILGSIISFVPVFLFFLLNVVAFKTRYKQFAPSFNLIDLKLRKELLSYSLQFFLIQVSAIVLYASANAAITYLFGPSEVVVYNIVYQYFRIPIMISSIIMTPIWSAVTSAYAQEDFIWLKTTLKKLNIISLYFSIFIIAMLIVSSYVYQIWIGDRIHINKNLSIAMAIYSIINIWLSPYSTFINGLGKIKLTAVLSFLGVAGYLLLIYLFALIFNNSISIVISMALISLIGLILQPLQVKKILASRAAGIWNK